MEMQESSRGCLWSWRERIFPSGSDLSCWTVLMQYTPQRGGKVLLVLGVTQQPPAPSPLCTPLSSQLSTTMVPELLTIMVPELLAIMVPQLLPHFSRRWEKSKDGHKFPAICPVGIPMQHICLCDTTNSLPFSNRKPERITHIHLVKDARLFTVIS